MEEAILGLILWCGKGDLGESAKGYTDPCLVGESLKENDHSDREWRRNERTRYEVKGVVAIQPENARKRGLTSLQSQVLF